MDVRIRAAAAATLVITLFALRPATAERRAADVVAVRPAAGAATLAGMAPIKERQRQLMRREPMHELQERAERHRELRKLAKRLKRSGKSQLIVRGDRSRPAESPDAPQAAPARPQAVRAGGPVVPPTNVLVNNRAGDSSTSGQSECSIAAFGSNVVAAWNDGQGFVTGGDGQGYAWSTNGGATWTDGGSPPHPAGFATWAWVSDPVIAVNERTGDFYYTGLADSRSGFNAIGVTRGAFAGNSFSWTSANLVREVANSSTGLDKEWVVADSLTGNLYLSYTAFGTTSSPIQFQRSTDQGATWGAPVTISTAPENADRVQGSRPVVDGDGTVYVMYYLIGLIDADEYRVARSVDAGVSFGGPVTAATVYVNFGTGQPGFNRELAVNFASLAVDRSTGPRRGRVYLAWGESLNWYDDILAPHTGGDVLDVEPDDTPANARTFTPGDYLRGTTSTSDPDWFRCTLAAGQSMVLYADSTAGSVLSHEMYVFAGDGTTRLGFTLDGPILFTAPTAGTYYVRGRAAIGSGGYRIQTAPASATVERGRDQSDVFVTSSANGTTWGTPVRINQSAPGYYEALPEIAVSGEGRVYVSWFDYRDATPTTNGGEASVYLARSDDGVTFTELGATTDARTAWSTVSSNIIPNQGDYMALFANATELYACWSDGRPVLGVSNPDIYTSVWPLALTPTLVSLVSASAEPGRVRIEWLVAANAGADLTLERAREGEAWVALGTLVPDGEGRVRYEDTDVVAGVSYHYRLAVPGASGPQYLGEATLTVPATGAFAIDGVRPNPAARDAFVSFTLPDGEPATVEVLDVTGRVVAPARRVTGAGRQLLRVADGTLRPGLYLVRVTHGGHQQVARFSLVR